MALRLENISKNFGSNFALKNISFALKSGECFILLGSHGAGKSALFRIISGLDQPDSGLVFLNENDITTQPHHMRRIGSLFEHDTLFPHLTVLENIACGLTVHTRTSYPSTRERDRRIYDLLEWAYMTDFQQHPVSHLSETQRFRVALARILALEPHLILLDDPFKRLDPHVRYDLFRWLYRLNRHTGHTILMATHFFEGLLEFSDRIAFLNNGIFEHSNAPDIIDAQIPSYMALNLMGESLELPIRIQRDQVFLDAIPLPLKAVPEKGALRVFVRAKDCLLVSWETFSEIQGRYIPLHIRGLIKNIHPTPRNTQHVSIEIPRHNSENLTWGMECSLHEFYTPGDWVAVIIRQVYSLSEDQCSPSVHKCEDFLIPS